MVERMGEGEASKSNSDFVPITPEEFDALAPGERVGYLHEKARDLKNRPETTVQKFRQAIQELQNALAELPEGKEKKDRQWHYNREFRDFVASLPSLEPDEGKDTPGSVVTPPTVPVQPDQEKDTASSDAVERELAHLRARLAAYEGRKPGRGASRVESKRMRKKVRRNISSTSTSKVGTEGQLDREMWNNIADAHVDKRVAAAETLPEAEPPIVKTEVMRLPRLGDDPVISAGRRLEEQRRLAAEAARRRTRIFAETNGETDTTGQKRSLWSRFWGALFGTKPADESGRHERIQAWMNEHPEKRSGKLRALRAATQENWYDRMTDAKHRPRGLDTAGIAQWYLDRAEQWQRLPFIKKFGTSMLVLAAGGVLTVLGAPGVVAAAPSIAWRIFGSSMSGYAVGKAVQRNMRMKNDPKNEARGAGVFAGAGTAIAVFVGGSVLGQYLADWLKGGSPTPSKMVTPGDMLPGPSDDIADSAPPGDIRSDVPDTQPEPPSEINENTRDPSPAPPRSNGDVPSSPDARTATPEPPSSQEAPPGGRPSPVTEQTVGRRVGGQGSMLNEGGRVASRAPLRTGVLGPTDPQPFGSREWWEQQDRLGR